MVGRPKTIPQETKTTSKTHLQNTFITKRFELSAASEGKSAAGNRTNTCIQSSGFHKGLGADNWTMKCNKSSIRHCVLGRAKGRAKRRAGDFHYISISTSILIELSRPTSQTRLSFYAVSRLCVKCLCMEDEMNEEIHKAVNSFFISFSEELTYFYLALVYVFPVINT